MLLENNSNVPSERKVFHFTSDLIHEARQMFCYHNF